MPTRRRRDDVRHVVPERRALRRQLLGEPFVGVLDGIDRYEHLGHEQTEQDRDPEHEHPDRDGAEDEGDDGMEACEPPSDPLGRSARRGLEEGDARPSPVGGRFTHLKMDCCQMGYT